jgi:YYY domain-containing protein
MQNVGTLETSQRETPTVRAERRSISRANLLVGFLLVVTMFVGGYFRFVGLNWDDFTHLHPDERFLTDVSQGLGGRLAPSDGSSDDYTPETQIQTCVERYPSTGGVGGFFDALCSTWNPHNANPGHGMYVYGTLPLFMTRATADIVVPLSEWWAHNISSRFDPTLSDYSGYQWLTYDGIHLIWRYLSALGEMAVIIVVFCIGLRLHSKWVGLVGAWLYACTVFSIQLSHFATTDALSNLFCAVSILFAVCVQRQGRLRDYVFFGMAFGAALASRINLLPLVGLIMLAAILRTMPAFDRHTVGGERERLIVKHLLGLVLAGLATLIVFRLTNPYTFNGPGILGLSLNPRWLQDIATAQSLVSGAIDSPPNFQWVARTPYLFPWWNMVMWGMGLPLGLAAWGSFIWAIYRLVTGKQGATLNILLIAWVTVYFGYMGRNWVTTMRYFIPIYPALVTLAAWGIVQCLQSAREQAAALGKRRFTPRKALAWGLIILVTGFTFLWAAMFTNIYRNQLTRVQASNWVWENVPSDFAMSIETPDGQGDALVSMNNGMFQTRAVPLINIGVMNRASSNNDLVNKVTRYDDSYPTSSDEFVAPASGIIRSVHAPHLGDPNDDPENEVFQITITDAETGEVIASARVDQNLTRETSIVGDPLDIPLDAPFEVEAGRRYRFNVEAISGMPFISGGAIIANEGAWDDGLPYKVCTLPLGITLADSPPSGLINDGRGCMGRDPWWGLVTSYEQNIVYEDDANKLQWLIDSLDQSDYLTISSNRFYDTLNRNDLRFPLSNVYYDALFSGELGFDLVATFQETYELGPLRVSDQYLPTYFGYNGGDLLNEYESEEAFSVYDHPVVFIFRRSENYDSQRVRDILSAVPLTRVYDAPVYNQCTEDPDLYFCTTQLVGVHTLSSEQADAAPTALQFTQQAWDTQTSGGTWSDRFDVNSIVNTNPIVGVAAWYGVMFLFGLAAFPLLFCFFPRLADRGYAAAKIAGIFLVAWVTWYLASLRIPVWSQTGIIVALIALAALSILTVWKQRGEFGKWIRLYWKRLVVIELITLAFFLIMLGVRLTNPDLWHDSFGGEKPMDFAYFNGVLRSTIFPPVDPWYAGGFINYYYFGFVIIGTPVLLLKMTPDFAYNLILPMLFCMTAIGAFSVAFSIGDVLGERKPDGKARRLGNRWVAGIAAAIMCVVLGNLDTPRVALNGLAQAGGYTQSQGFEQWLLNDYTAQNGDIPDDATLISLMERADQNNIGDRIRYELNVLNRQITSIVGGINRLREGGEVYVSPDRWFWGPSRIYSETPGVEGSAITEMPAFTFIYADMHAHMISMPMQLLILAFLLNEILVAGRDPRRRWVQFAALAFGAILVGMLRATNTWDWITYMLLGTLGLGYAWWLKWRTISRWSLLDMVARVGGFVLITFVAVLPFTTWFASGYNSIRLWTDGKTPLWAYFDVHGLFLFLIISLLAWETGRWLHSVTVKTLRGTWALLLAGVVVALLMLGAAIFLSMKEYQVTLIALPLIVWTAVLFFRQKQQRAMQFVLALIGLGLGLTLGVEYIVLDGDIGRQNTVFKFYIQVWLMFSVVGGVALACLWRASERWRGGLRYAWTGVLVLLLAVAALFPVKATQGKAVYRMEPPAGEDGTRPPIALTLNGMDFMRYATRWEGDADVLASDPDRAPFPLAGDYEMIHWLQDNVQGTPIIIEGLGDDTQYRWNGRISIYTGLPAVVGWNFHQRQQRTLDPMGRLVEFRNANVNGFYETTSIPLAWAILQRYNVEYVIVGAYERAYYSDAGLAKFDQMVDLGMLTVVFESGDSVIYQVNQDAQLMEVG